jgi:hypothetical protein
MKMTVFWDAAPCSLVKIDRRFGGAYCFHRLGDPSISTWLHSVTSQKTVMFILAAVRTWNLTQKSHCFSGLLKIALPLICLIQSGFLKCCTLIDLWKVRRVY